MDLLYVLLPLPISLALALTLSCGNPWPLWALLALCVCTCLCVFARGPRTKQQAFLSNTQSSLYSGFRADFPKAQFPSVDVRAVGDLQ
eukprot:1154363-Pelagomonas_calceolata.AAC.8